MDKKHSHDTADVSGHPHTHGAADRTMLSTERGIRAIKVGFVGLLATALMQVVVVWFTGSVALLSDTVHNFGDCLTALPLWAAFRLARMSPSRKYTYGYGRVEDLAGLAIVAVIFASGAFAIYESAHRIFNPQDITYVWAVAMASVIGFGGNEAVAVYRIRAGRDIGSAALVADGYHARVDGWTSLAVLAGAGGVWLGYPLVDPIVGVVIGLAIMRIVWQTGRSVLRRLLDGVDPEVVDEIESVAAGIPEVEKVTNVRVRWQGHRMLAEVSITVPGRISVEKGHQISAHAEGHLLEKIGYLSLVSVHVDPEAASGDELHQHLHADGHQPAD